MADVQKSQSDILEIVSDLKEHDTLKDKLEESILDNHCRLKRTLVWQMDSNVQTIA